MNICFDCQKEIQEENGELLNGKQLKYKNGEKDIYIFKCNECFEKSQALTNYQPTEVFSRVCGYFRPVSQWHKGKQEEYNQRVNFKQ